MEKHPNPQTSPVPTDATPTKTIEPINGMSAGDVIAFAKSDGGLPYDEIARRYLSVSEECGPLPVNVGRRKGEVETPDPGVDKAYRLGVLRRGIHHLSFNQLPSDGHFGYEITGGEICCRLSNGKEGIERWYSLAHPPCSLAKAARNYDATTSLYQTGEIAIPDILWLPFRELLNTGRFIRMQECDERLTVQIERRCYYVFISHRWLTRTHPDPSGLQASLVAWQILGYLVEAVWVASARGRHAPRTLWPGGSSPVGPSGSEFAESILVNFLRGLSDREFEQLVTEAPHYDDLNDHGAAIARTDIDLSKLRHRLSKTPGIAGALDRFRIWYDYSCMPQHVRTEEEQQRFEFLLRRLGTIQACARTLVLLDDVEDYLSRGWCTYEAVLASEYYSNSLEGIDGAENESERFENRKLRLSTILIDRCHLVRRGILDTEVFGIQTPDVCMKRLGLATTRPEDMSTVYGLLRDLGPPTSIHYDAGEILTGVFCLPLNDGAVVIVERSGRILEKRDHDLQTFEFQDGPALPLLDPSKILPFRRLSEQDAPTCHLAIFGSCEGEAMLYANQLLGKLAKLENITGIPISSISWVASDVAPVGHTPCGKLEVTGIDASVWIVAGSNADLTAGHTSGLLLETLHAVGIEMIELSMDLQEGNLRRYQRRRKEGKPLDDHKLVGVKGGIRLQEAYPGGLFRDQFHRMAGREAS